MVHYFKVKICEATIVIYVLALEIKLQIQCFDMLPHFIDIFILRPEYFTQLRIGKMFENEYSANIAFVL